MQASHRVTLTGEARDRPPPIPDKTQLPLSNAVKVHVPRFNLERFWQHLAQFRADYAGELAIQTMLLAPWSAEQIAAYAARLRAIAPDELQLNVPRRPKPRERQLDGRENHSPASARPYAIQPLRCLEPEAVQGIARSIQQESGIPTRCSPAL